MFNWVKTFVLMAAITALFGAIGQYFGGEQGMLLALGFLLLAAGLPLQRRQVRRLKE